VVDFCNVFVIGAPRKPNYQAIPGLVGFDKRRVTLRFKLMDVNHRDAERLADPGDPLRRLDLLKRGSDRSWPCLPLELRPSGKRSL
jgi:hypothetical protein